MLNDSRILAFISTVGWRMDREDRGRRMKKEESGSATAACCHRPLAAVPGSQLRPPLPVLATCAGPHLAAASYTKTTAAHTYSTAAIARTPTLPWSAGSTVVLTTDVVAVTSVWVCLVSPVGLVSVICPVLQCNTRTSDFPYSVVAARDFKLRLRREVYSNI